MTGVTRKLARVSAAFGAVVASVLMFGSVADAKAQAACSDPAQEGTVQLRFQDQDKESNKTPIAGIAISVADAGGEVVGEAVSDEDGWARVPVCGRDTYTVTIDESTIPDGKALLLKAGESGNVQTVTVGTTGKGTKNVFTGESSVKTESWVKRVPQRLMDGARLGLVIAITSVGLSLIFGTTGLTNFAHGEMVTFGGMAAFVLNVAGLGFLSWLPFFDDGGRVHLLIAAPIAVALGGLFGWALDAVIWSPLRKRGIGLVTQLVVSVGLSILLKNFFQLRFGGRAKPLNDFADQVQWKWGPVGITPRDFTTAIISLIVLVAVALALQRTRLGKATRAVSDNVDLASATGIDSQKVIRLVWFVGGALAALGGIIRALDEQANFDMGANLLFLMFAGITLGGLGSAFGALLGGFIIGILTELLSLAVPSELKAVPPLLILVFMLLVRPQGLLGSKERVG
jgi:neutral amino acid transport system permease protein